jgi:hypothetical protein
MVPFFKWSSFVTNFRLVNNCSSEVAAFNCLEIKILNGFRLDSIFRIRYQYRYPVKTVDRLNTIKVDEYCVIRNWVYKFLESDIRHLFKENEVSFELNITQIRRNFV